MTTKELVEIELQIKRIEGDVTTARLDPNALQVNSLDMEISALNSIVGQVFVNYQGKADKWKQYNKTLVEMSRSLRRIHETLNTERRMN